MLVEAGLPLDGHESGPHHETPLESARTVEAATLLAKEGATVRHELCAAHAVAVCGRRLQEVVLVVCRRRPPFRQPRVEEEVLRRGWWCLDQLQAPRLDVVLLVLEAAAVLGFHLATQPCNRHFLKVRAGQQPRQVVAECFIGWRTIHVDDWMVLVMQE